MDALISARASAAAMIEGNECRVIFAADPLIERRIDIGSLKHIFSAVPDCLYLKKATRESVQQRLLVEVRFDDALRLTFISLDPTESADLRAEAACELALCFEDAGSRDFVANNLFSNVPQSTFDIATAVDLMQQYPSVATVIRHWWNHREAISRVRDAWDALPKELFENRGDEIEFLNYAANLGVFQLLAISVLEGGTAVNRAIVESLMLLKKLPNYRSVVTAWTKDFKGASVDYFKQLKIIAAQDSEALELFHKAGESRLPGGFAAFTNVLAQQDAVAAQIRSGNNALARRYMSQLVEMQVQANTREFGAKSLCKVAQIANSCGQYSLQLEWSKSATELSPMDPMTFGHLADAFVSLNRFDEALAALDRVEQLGDRRFARTNRASVLRLQGRLDEALTAFAELKEEFGVAAENGFAWNGYAEVLKDMSKFDDAIRAYDDASGSYPTDLVARCAKASILSEVGRLDEALKIFNDVLEHPGNDEFALTGKANVLKHLGDLDGALAIYDKAILKFPTRSICLSGRASILRSLRRFEEALQTIKSGRNRFPYDSSFSCELAEWLVDQGRLKEGLQEYARAVRDFPADVRVLNGWANALKKQGDLKGALSAFDESIRKFPFNIFSRNARADLLKRLGSFEDALIAYDDIIQRWPEKVGARHSKAAILVILGRLAEAEALLPTSEPNTLDEWIAYHVRGMILLRKNLIDEAQALFSFGARKVPFFRERKYFESALVAIYLKRQEFEEAYCLLDKPSEVISNVLLMHVYAATGDKARALGVLKVVQQSYSAQIFELSEEIAKRFQLSPGEPMNDENWIFRRECDLVLLEAA